MVACMNPEQAIQEAQSRLIDAGGRISQDLGAGRIVGMMLIFLYLQEKECSLDRIVEELNLSKASVSIAARQLEQFGLVYRVWRSGERKKYYRSADNISQAIQKGFFGILLGKVKMLGEELDRSRALLKTIEDEQKQEIDFFIQRIARASELQKKLTRIFSNPLIKALIKDR